MKKLMMMKLKVKVMNKFDKLNLMESCLKCSEGVTHPLILCNKFVESSWICFKCGTSTSIFGIEKDPIVRITIEGRRIVCFPCAMGWKRG